MSPHTSHPCPRSAHEVEESRRFIDVLWNTRSFDSGSASAQWSVQHDLTYWHRPTRDRVFGTATIVAKESPMPRQQHVVTLSNADRQQVRHLIGAGVAPARQLTRARILLKVDT